MADSFSLSGKIALVTGASGGLGRHFANVLAGAGAHVVAAARRMDKVTETVAGIEAAGGRALGLRMDVTDSASVAQAFQAIEEQAGLVTVLVNNAGVADGQPALDVTEEDWDRVMDTNLKGAWTVAQEAARRMTSAGEGGVIINISSVLGLRVSKGVVAYAVSKAGLVQMTKALALELAPHNIRVNALSAGPIRTLAARGIVGLNDMLRVHAERAALKRNNTVDEVGDAALFLCSPLSRGITGEVIYCDAGYRIMGM